MPDGLVQWFDVHHAEGRVVHGGREYVLRGEDAEPAARHAGARVHFDIIGDDGAERAANARLEPRPAQAAGGPAVTVVSRGVVPEESVAYARQKIGRVIEQTALPVLFARVELLHHGDPARERPAVVEASLDVEGRLVRAHRAAHDFREAVDLAEQRLRDRLEHLADQRRALSRGGAPMVPGEWRHASPSIIRPDVFPRPPEERELVRHKALPLGEMTVDEAAFDMELLDHDFYLFREIGGSGDSLLVRHDGRHRLLRTEGGPQLPPGTNCDVDVYPPPELDVDDAIEQMDVTGEPFVFFRHRDSGRGEVLYRRYDGHYGLIEPAD